MLLILLVLPFLDRVSQWVQSLQGIVFEQEATEARIAQEKLSRLA